MHAPASELANRGVHFRPRVEDTYRKPQCCPLVHSVGTYPWNYPMLDQPRATPDRLPHISVRHDRGFDPDQSWNVAGGCSQDGGSDSPRTSRRATASSTCW